MKEIMKKIYLFLLAAAGIFAVASCAREELAEPESLVSATDEVTSLTLSFDNTKTALVDGKTTWEEGDKVRIINSTGTFSQDVEVPADAAGKASFSAEVNMKDTLYYAVYPVESSKGVSGGKVVVNLPKNPDGRFASANICVAATKGTDLQLRNVTAVLKISVNSGNKVELLQIIAQNPIIGDYAVGFEGDELTFAPSSTASSVTVATGGIDGDYYVPVLPGTFAKDFSVTALRGNGGYQNKKTTEDNEVKVNTLIDLGVIGDDLSDGIPGEGTAEKPFTISSQPEFIAFATSVTMGKTYEGEVVSLEADIDDAITAPAGYYLSDDEQGYFSGTFLGNNHSINVEFDGDNCKAQTYVALFAVVDKGATVKDLKVKGTAKATANYTSGIIGYIRGAEDARVTVSNCTSDVVVTSTGYRVAGIAGYASYAVIDNCINNAAVTGYDNVAGIVGYSYYNTISNCQNQAEVKATTEANTSMFVVSYNTFMLDSFTTNNNWTYGVGGIAGFCQNSTLSSVANTAAVSGNIKVGGIVGLGYWSTVSNSVNSGVITGNGSMNLRADSQMGQQWGSVTGGIVGYIYTHGVVSDCINNGTVKGHGGIGGIVGNITCGNNSASAPTVKGCKNNGAIESTNAYQGGTSACANSGTGGIVGNLVPYGFKINNVWYCYNPSVLKCHNTASVKSVREDGQANFVGGIVGSSYFAGAVTNRGQSIIDGCVNDGDVTGGYWVGGIMGGAGCRYAGIPTIRNCVNHGTVRADGKSVKYNAILAGGLVGGAMAYNTGNRTSQQFRIYNSYNDGDVVYSLEDYATPYIGGVIGSTWGAVEVKNVYSSGFVGGVSREDPDDAVKKCLGALVGYQHVANNVTNSYYPASLLGGQAMGTNGKAAAASVAGFDEKFEFTGAVTYNETDYDNLLDILNAWVGTSTTYYGWVAGSNGPQF